MTNERIRKELKKDGVYLWEVAKALNVSESTITRKMRSELSTEDKRAFEDAIRTIRKGKE